MTFPSRLLKSLHRPLLLAACGCLLVAGAAQNTPVPPAPKRPMTFADLMAIKRVSDPQVSPSGHWVLFSVTDVSLEKNSRVNHLWAVPLSAPNGAAPKERQLTAASGETNGRFSPDGRTVSFTADDTTGQPQIMLAAWNESDGTLGPAHPLTHLATGADGAIWAPDSKRLLFVSSVFPECSDKPAWPDEDACNGAHAKAEADNPVKARVFTGLLYRHWNAFTGNTRSHVLVVSATDGSAVRDLTPRSAVGDAETPTFSLGGPLGYAWAPDSHEIAYVTNLDKVPAASTNNDIFTLRLDDPTAKPIKISTSPGSDDGPAYSPDGKWLAFRSQARAGFESDKFRLMLFDREKRTARQLMSKAIPKNGPMMGVPAFDLGIDEFTWAADPGYLLFVADEKGEAPLYRVNVEGTDLHRLGKVQGEWSSIAVARDNTVVGSLVRVDRAAEIAAVAQQDADDTTRTFLLDFNHPRPVNLNAAARPSEEMTTPTVEPRWLSHLNDGLLGQLSLAKLEPFWFTGAENTKVQGFLIRPPNFDPSKKYPVKFLIHGGPQGAWGDAWSFRWNPELMAASGYVVVMVNPRGSTGYGQKFVDQVSGDWGGRAYVDLMRGLDAAEAKFPFIDKTRECALGASYGGFMANWILTHTNRFQCIVTHDGMYNPAAAYGDTEEMWFNEWEFRRAADFPSPGNPGHPAEPWRYAAGPLADDPFRKWSPMLHIQDAHTPTLVIHSQRDFRLDVSEGFQLFTALQRLNVPSKMLYFPDEGHWVLKPRNSQLWNETVTDWCDRWTHTNQYAAAK